MGVRGLFVHVTWVRRVAGGDSGALVDPFMHVGTYPTRHLATLSNPIWVGPYLRLRVHKQFPSPALGIWSLRRPPSMLEITSLSLYFRSVEAS